EAYERIGAFISDPALRADLFMREAQTYEAEGRPPRALQLYQSASRLQPSNLGYAFAVAQAYEKMERYGEAISAIRGGLQAAGADPSSQKEWIARLEAK